MNEHRNYLVWALGAILMASSLQAATQARPYVIHANLETVLAPPPTTYSAQTKAELSELEVLQATRTKEQEADAVADQQYSVFRFADVVGPGFREDQLPKTAALFDRVVATSQSAANSVKATWLRPRPYLSDPSIHPCVEPSKSSSYPSGHAIAGTVMAIVLANLLPGARNAIFARGWHFAENRLVAGVHHRSDIEAGRIAGTVVAAEIFNDSDYQQERTAVAAELTKAYPNLTAAGQR